MRPVKNTEIPEETPMGWSFINPTYDDLIRMASRLADNRRAYWFDSHTSWWSGSDSTGNWSYTTSSNTADTGGTTI